MGMNSDTGRVDVHHVVSRIVNRYIAVLSDEAGEGNVREWLIRFREKLWKLCQNPSGLCSVDVLNSSIEDLLRSYERFLYETAYAYEIKLRVYEILLKILSEIEDYLRTRSITGFSYSSKLEKPSMHRVEIVFKPGIDKREKLHLEISGLGGYYESFTISSSRNLIEMPTGSYKLRLLKGGSEVYRESFKVSGDVTLSIALEKVLKKHSEAMRRGAREIGRVAGVGRWRVRTSLKRIVRVVTDLRYIAVILILMILVLDLIILLR
ncbi:MAG: hypothetical protein QXD76_03720 [Sulfolobales archaeon]